jgi:hypothetical protein
MDAPLAMWRKLRGTCGSGLVLTSVHVRVFAPRQVLLPLLTQLEVISRPSKSCVPDGWVAGPGPTPAPYSTTTPPAKPAYPRRLGPDRVQLRQLPPLEGDVAEDEAAVQAAVVDVSAVRDALGRYFANADARRRQFCFMPQLDAAAPPTESFATILQAWANTRVSMGPLGCVHPLFPPRPTKAIERASPPDRRVLMPLSTCATPRAPASRSSGRQEHPRQRALPPARPPDQRAAKHAAPRLHQHDGRGRWLCGHARGRWAAGVHGPRAAR